jgi:hypothetical protein
MGYERERYLGAFLAAIASFLIDDGCEGNAVPVPGVG